MNLQEKYVLLRQRLFDLAGRLEMVAKSAEERALFGLPKHLTPRDAWQGEGTYLRGEAAQCRSWAEEIPLVVEPDECGSAMPPTNRLTCTRIKGHRGYHRAQEQTGSTRLLHEWPNRGEL